MQLTLEQWFDIVCDDLDPERKWKRPRFELDNWWGDCAYYAQASLVSIDSEIVMKHGWNIYDAVAHEVRHWWQYQVGKLSRDGIRAGFYWHDTYISPEYMYLVGSQAEYEELPWEADAIAYASEVCARLLSKHEGA